MTEPEKTATRRWWLNLQLALGVSGGAVWFAGAMWEQDFIAGVGFGLIAAALVLRLGRRSAEERT